MVPTKTLFSAQTSVYQRLQVALRRLAVVGAVLASSHAAAYSALTNADLNLRAGPDRDFPVVHTLRQSTPVEVMGCQSDYQWCDVRVESLRGWVRADYLSATFENGEVNVAERGASIGLPVLAFIIGAYWADHYFDRPWYRRHSHWQHWHYQPRPPGWRPPHRPPGWRPPPPSRPSGWRPLPARPPMARPGVRPAQVVPPRPSGVRPLPARPPVARPGDRPSPGGMKPRPSGTDRLPPPQNRQ
ncbi:MAG: SH3 domain-containing protein [Rhodoferax sp.]|nr:SH3 domain-containing protein [Rhodoferax sp.]